MIFSCLTSGPSLLSRWQIFNTICFFLRRGHSDIFRGGSAVIEFVWNQQDTTAATALSAAVCLSVCLSLCVCACVRARLCDGCVHGWSVTLSCLVNRSVHSSPSASYFLPRSVGVNSGSPITGHYPSQFDHRCIWPAFEAVTQAAGDKAHCQCVTASHY